MIRRESVRSRGYSIEWQMIRSIRWSYWHSNWLTTIRRRSTRGSKGKKSLMLMLNSMKRRRKTMTVRSFQVMTKNAKKIKRVKVPKKTNRRKSRYQKMSKLLR